MKILGRVLDVGLAVVCLRCWHVQMKETVSASRMEINPESACVGISHVDNYLALLRLPELVFDEGVENRCVI